MEKMLKKIKGQNHSEDFGKARRTFFRFLPATVLGLLVGRDANAQTWRKLSDSANTQPPIGTISGIAKGNGANALTSAIAGTDYGFPTIPQNIQSAAYTLVLSDSGKHIFHPSSDTTARTFTIPANSSVAFSIGTAVTFINETSAGVVTIAINADTLILAGSGSVGSRTLAANGLATAIKITSTKWIISGSGLT
jgi:hypothetical protein